MNEPYYTGRRNQNGGDVWSDGSQRFQGPATYSQVSSGGSVTTPNSNDPTTMAFTAMFANARTPQEQADIRQRYASAMTQQQDEDRGLMREDRNFSRAEPSRQFDERTNLLRMIMGGGSPFGGQPQTAYGQGDGWQGGRFTGQAQQGGYQMPPMQQALARPDPMKKNLDNYLAQLLGWR